MKYISDEECRYQDDLCPKIRADELGKSAKEFQKICKLRTVHAKERK